MSSGREPKREKARTKENHRKAMNVLNLTLQIEASTRTHISETRHAHLDQLHDSAVTLNQVRDDDLGTFLNDLLPLQLGTRYECAPSPGRRRRG